MDKLDSSLQQRVQQQFANMEQRIATVAETLTTVEHEFQVQQKKVTELLEDEQAKVEVSLSKQEMLLRNVK